MKLRKRRLHAGIWFAVGLSLVVASAIVLAVFFSGETKVAGPPPEKAAAKHVDDTKKTPAQKASYEVPADHPRELIISKLGIDANVLSMGVLSDGSLDAPKSAWDVGWYDQSALPGSGQGALLIDGHVNNSLGTPGVFFRLATLRPGDGLQIQRGDRKTVGYRVVRVEQKPVAQVDMAMMMRSITPGKQGLNLITCGGDYDYEQKTFRDRVLVYAEQAS